MEHVEAIAQKPHPLGSAEAEPVRATFVTSTAIVTSGMFDHPSALSIGHGATLALQCEICHGADGRNKADAPSLAGQYPGAIYKELKDFKDGARSSAVMAPLAAVLSDSAAIAPEPELVTPAINAPLQPVFSRLLGTQRNAC